MSMWTIVMMVAISLVAVEAWPQQGLEPILAEEPGYSCYACAQTGYHGLNRQEVAYLALKPVERTSLPGYKGSLVRLTDGELVACSWDHFWHSTDEGQSWEEFEAQGVPKSIKESRLICLRDGSVLLTLGDIYRSTDGGRTWEKCARERPQGHSMPTPLWNSPTARCCYLTATALAMRSPVRSRPPRAGGSARLMEGGPGQNRCPYLPRKVPSRSLRKPV